MIALLDDFHKKKVRHRRLYFALIIMMVVLLLIMPLLAEAQLSECQGIQREGYKVLLDGLSYSQDIFRTDKDLRMFMDRLSWKLQTKIESLLTEGRAIRVMIITCPERRPVDGSEFSKNIVDGLNSRDVVLEVWGTLDAIKERDKIRNKEARIRYIVIPLKHYKGSMGGIYLVSYFKESFGSEADFIDMLDQAAEFDALLFLGIGVKSLRARNYDLSLQCLRTAKLKLEDIARKKPGFATNQRELSDYIDNAVRDCIQTAKDDPEYRGAIRLIGGR